MNYGLKTMNYIVGIDEVGRGPLAGPVSVGIVVVAKDFDYSVFGTFGDSKKMTETARERVHTLATEVRDHGGMQFGVFSVNADQIDKQGIVSCIALATEEGLADLAVDPATSFVYLDGSLKAPRQYRQESLVRGDSLVPAISLASVVAKVERDRYMTSVAHSEYPAYGFDSHKGYGTKAHYAALYTHGLSPLHRRSFLKSVLDSQHDR